MKNYTKSRQQRFLWTTISMALLFHMTSYAQTGPGSTWNPDYNDDGQIGAPDLLGFLTVFGADSDGDGVWDGADLCQDEQACNFLANPTAECQFVDATGVCGGFCEEDSDGDGTCDWLCGVDSVEFSGHSYATVQIGNTCWFKENCRALPEVIPFNGPSNAYLPKAIVIGYAGESVEEAMAHENYQSFGAIYNLPALTSWALCPQGWELAGPVHWDALVSLAGGYAVAGLNLKSSTHWNGLDLFGFDFRGGPTAGYNGKVRTYRWIRKSPTENSLLHFGDGDDLDQSHRYSREHYPARCVQSED